MVNFLKDVDTRPRVRLRLLLGLMGSSGSARIGDYPGSSLQGKSGGFDLAHETARQLAQVIRYLTFRRPISVCCRS